MFQLMATRNLSIIRLTALAKYFILTIVNAKVDMNCLPTETQTEKPYADHMVQKVGKVIISQRICNKRKKTALPTVHSTSRITCITS